MRRGVGLVVLALLAAGCSGGPSPSPPPDTDAARQVAVQLAAALEKKDLKPVEFADAPGPETDAELQPLVRGMGTVSPRVEVTDVSGSGDQASATLGYRWAFPGTRSPGSPSPGPTTPR